MRQLVTVILIVAAGCTTTQPDRNVEPQEIVISGRIQGAYFHQDKVKVRITNDFERREEFEVAPDSTDFFFIRFKQRWPGRLKLEIGDNSFYVHYFPGDSVYISGYQHIDNDTFRRSLKFSGRSANKYQYFQRNTVSVLNHYIDDLDGRAHNAPYTVFKQLIDSMYQFQLQQFSEDTVGLALDEGFVTYETNYLKYGWLERTVREPMLRLHLRHDSTEVPATYFDFLKTVDWSDTTFLNSYYFYRFLKSSFGALNQEPIPQYLGMDRTRAHQRVYRKFSDSLLSGKSREYFQTIMLDGLEEGDIDYFDSLKLSMRAKGYNNFLLDHFDQLSDSLRSMQLTLNDQTSVTTPQGKVLRLLDKMQEHDYTYLNIWFVGCKGCAIDFSNQGYFVKKYGDKIRFINVCVSKPGDHFDNFIKNYPEVGDQYFDNKGSLRKQVHVYPYHGLFNRKGELIKNHVYRPSDERLDGYLDRLIENGS